MAIKMKYLIAFDIIYQYSIMLLFKYYLFFAEAKPEEDEDLKELEAWAS